MKKMLKKFGGALFLYVVIFIGIVAISSRVNYVNNINETEKVVAFNK